MITTYFKLLIMRLLFHLPGSTSLPAKYYLGWSKTPPTASGTNFTEPAAVTGYKRIEATGLTIDSNGVVSNSAALSFPESLAAQGVASYLGIFDAPTGGNLLIYKQLKRTVDIPIETTATLKIGALKISLVNLAMAVSV